MVPPHCCHDVAYTMLGDGMYTVSMQPMVGHHAMGRENDAATLLLQCGLYNPGGWGGHDIHVAYDVPPGEG